MKLGFGLYRHMLNEEHYKFAKQCGATHLVIHLVDYFGHNKDNADQPIGGEDGWGKAGGNEIWTLEAEIYSFPRVSLTTLVCILLYNRFVIMEINTANSYLMESANISCYNNGNQYRKQFLKEDV